MFMKLTKRFYSSSLYITGNKAQNNYAILVPHIDFDERIRNDGELEQNVRLRGLDIDVAKVQNRWNFFKNVEAQKIILESLKEEIAKTVKDLMKDEEKHQAKVVQLKQTAVFVKNDLKILKDYLYELEETAVLHVLNLPNVLHPTASDRAKIDYIFLEPPHPRSKSHIDIGKELKIIDLKSPLQCYLKNEAALYELQVLNYISDHIKSEFTQFSNADFVKSLIIEGCGDDYQESNSVFNLEDNESNSQLHLVGGASLYSFMSFFTRHLVQKTFFPLKYFTVGRKYLSKQGDNCSLFNLPQETAIDIFIATVDNEDEFQKEYNQLVAKIRSIYEAFELPFRLVYVPARDLKKCESLRLSVQLYSCNLQDYVEVGHVSQCDTYLSKRLLFAYSENKERKFPKVISCNLLRVQPFLGCALEYCHANNVKLLDTLPQSLI